MKERYKGGFENVWVGSKVSVRANSDSLLVKLVEEG